MDFRVGGSDKDGGGVADVGNAVVTELFFHPRSVMDELGKPGEVQLDAIVVRRTAA